MKKFFWIGKTEKRAEGDASKRRVEIVTPRMRDPKAELRVTDPKTPARERDAKANAPATAAKADAKSTPAKAATSTPAKAEEAKATSASAASGSTFEPKPIVPPPPRSARDEDDTRPTRFSSAPPPPPSSSTATLGASDVRLVVTCLACAAKNRVPAARLADRSRCAKCQQPLTPVTRVLPLEAESVLDAMATSPVPVLVWLGAAWSGPSSLLGIELEKLASERAGHLVVVRVDVDHRPNLARRFLVESVPTMVLLRRGREEGREVGVLPALALRKRFGI
ncbi:MAG: thioredoxin domain-containing protein [Myxococcota bacterium]|jgi:thioredoxin 2|nr:thioredoxin domain-containing protein [Myxococcota bacterium]